MNGGAGQPVRFGLVGLDSPHAPSFTRLLNGVTGVPLAAPGGRITAAWPGEKSMDFPLSRDRLDGFAETVRALGVPITATLEEVAERSDALLIVAVDARRHPDLFHRCARFGKPVYVDTRFALSVPEARAMLAEARRHGVLPMTGSPKRFSEAFRAAMSERKADGIDVSGPMPLQPTQPGLFWYGIHMVDLVVAAMGTGCAEVCARTDGPDELIVATWHDGRTATIRGFPQWLPRTRGVIRHGAAFTEFTIPAEERMLVGLLEVIVASCRSGEPMIQPDEIAHVVAVTAAANQSRARNRPSEVDPVHPERSRKCDVEEQRCHLSDPTGPPEPSPPR